MTLDTLTVNGINSGDCNIYVLSNNDEDYPERVYEEIELPTRTGGIFIDTGKWKNKDVVYHCICTESPTRNVPRFQTLISRTTGYARIEDTLHTDYVKFGVLRGSTKPDFRDGKKTALFDLVFNCDPRKWDVSSIVGYDTWIDLTPGTSSWWGATGDFFAARYIAPRFRMRGIDKIEFGTKVGDGSITWKTIVKFNRTTTSAVEYDTETLHLYGVSSGASADYAIQTRYVPGYGEQVCPINNCDRFYLIATARSDATDPVARVNLRAYAL